ncbi:MAG: nucleoside triphosphate pyrophosphatase [Longimicrobiales bacterium]
MTPVVPRLVLASGSPRRADVLRQLGLEPEVRAADIDETYLPGETPTAHVERLARAKAETVAAHDRAALTVGGDTVVVIDGRVLSKPRDADYAVGMLMSLAGREHEVYSGIAVAGAHGVVSAVACTVVRFRPFGADVARQYVGTGEPLDKAGAYGIQGLGAALIDSIDGDYYCVVGFPVGAFLDLLARAGWRYEFGRLTPR